MHPNTKAFLHVVRTGEGTVGADGYRKLFGGDLIDDLSAHPRIAKRSKWGWTSAAGAYQAMAVVPGKVKTDTWDRFLKAEGPHDFRPASQDAFALWCLRQRNALADVEAGRLDSALEKCSWEWASLPAPSTGTGRYGQPVLTIARARSLYLAAGGQEESFRPVSITEIATGRQRPQPKQETQPMPAPFLMAALPALLQIAPDLVRLFGREGSRVSERNIAVVEKVTEMAKEITGKDTVEGAVVELEKSPEKQAEFRETVAASMDELVGMISRLSQMDEASRDAAARRAAADRVVGDLAPLMVDRQFWMYAGTSMAVLIALAVAVWTKAPSEVTVGLLVLFTGMVNKTIDRWGTMVEYRFGSSSGSQAKDVLLAEEIRRRQ
jgi:muramidase (phage lysozyme)